MRNSLRCLVVVVVCLTLLTSDAETVRCYRCNYVGFLNGSSRCNDPINPRYPPSSTCIGKYCTKLKGTKSERHIRLYSEHVVMTCCNPGRGEAKILASSAYAKEFYKREPTRKP
ncbi:hypothetical protein LSH36_356g02045 [Paralvinella palmiformis]|uniref:Secreted protein n=1 Tax=Paralvinella palmiformis TaxID=53620 RepID=A0AAD9MZJ9_9ANNE|nr:hypothetical protein LSH36_356g02045 [Paralvinella palmiformis]